MGRTNAWTSQVNWHTGRWQTRGPAPGPRPWSPPLRRGILAKRPLTFFEVLDSGFRLLRFAPGPAIGAPLIVLSLWTLLLTAVGTGLALTFLPFLRDLMGNDEALSGFSLLAQLGSFVFSLLSLGLVHFLAGLTVPAAEASFGARRMGLAESWRGARGRRWRLVLAAGLITGIDLGLLLVLLVPATLLSLAEATVPAVVVGVLSPPPLGLRGRLGQPPPRTRRHGHRRRGARVPAAVARSWRLTGRGLWRLLGQLGLGYVLSNQLIQLILSPFLLVVTTLAVIGLAAAEGDVAVMTAIGIVVGAVVLALTTISSAVLFGYFSCLVCACYFDARMRGEGYDLVLIRGEEERAHEHCRRPRRRPRRPRHRAEVARGGARRDEYSATDLTPLERLGRWVDDMLSGLVSAALSGNSPWLLLLVVLALATIVVLIVWRVRRLGLRRVQVPVSAFDAVVAAPRPRPWRQSAQAATDRGDLRTAVADQARAIFAVLAARGVVDLDDAATASELARTAGRAVPPVRRTSTGSPRSSTTSSSARSRHRGVRTTNCARSSHSSSASTPLSPASPAGPQTGAAR